jgi:ribosomal-protein-alanine N-acetyltransferase
MIITPMQRAHIAAVLEIERSTSLAPWSDRGFIKSIEHHQARVYCDAKHVCGFAVYRQTGDQAELLNIAIALGHQGTGCGGRLLRAMIYELRGKIRQLSLEVRVSNFRAIRLYYQHNFIQVGERRGYYPTADEHRREDALVMCREF